MKIKYYLLGLGIGIVLTTLIFTFSNANKRPSDKEIIERAKVLGMVMKEDNNVLDQILEDNPTGAQSQPSLVPSLTPSPESAINPTLEPTPNVIPTVEPTKPSPTGILGKNIVQDDKKEINFTIENGMPSGKVAALLVKVGLIENADDFNQYIVNCGKASIIRIGTYSLPEGLTYSEIVKEITTIR